MSGIFLYISENVLEQTCKASNSKFEPQWNDGENSFEIGNCYAFFCKLVAFNFTLNCVKGLELQKMSDKYNDQI